MRKPYHERGRQAEFLDPGSWVAGSLPLGGGRGRKKSGYRDESGWETCRRREGGKSRRHNAEKTESSKELLFQDK
jgi:hypothetical protein